MKLGKNINVVFETDTVMYFEGDGNYTKVYFQHGKKQLYARCLSFLHEKVGEQFVRIHRKYLVNRNYIKTNNLDSVELHNGLILTISRAKQRKILNVKS
jgi:two-component system, LytTR family, response regulator